MRLEWLNMVTPLGKFAVTSMASTAVCEERANAIDTAGLTRPKYSALGATFCKAKHQRENSDSLYCAYHGGYSDQHVHAQSADGRASWYMK